MKADVPVQSVRNEHPYDSLQVTLWLPVGAQHGIEKWPQDFANRVVPYGQHGREHT